MMEPFEIVRNRSFLIVYTTSSRKPKPDANMIKNLENILSIKIQQEICMWLMFPLIPLPNQWRNRYETYKLRDLVALFVNTILFYTRMAILMPKTIEHYFRIGVSKFGTWLILWLSIHITPFIIHVWQLYTNVRNRDYVNSSTECADSQTVASICDLPVEY